MRNILVTDDTLEAIEYALEFLSKNCDGENEKDALMVYYLDGFLESVRKEKNQKLISSDVSIKANELLNQALADWFHHKDCEKKVRDKYWYKVMGIQEMMDALSISRPEKEGDNDGC